jgi:hypothetical protein
MLTRTRIVIASVLVLGSVSSVLAESYDYNPQDRWPEARTVTQLAIAMTGHEHATAPSKAEKAQFARASRVVDGGGF